MEEHLMAQQINFFHKGISSDADYSKRTNDVWDFPTLNVRVLNKEGQGFILTNLDGNTNKITGYDFQISSGYFIIGACQYNGIVYIFSMDNSSNNEIGCFPSPNTLDYDGTAGTHPSTIIFQRQYRPLMNYTTNNAPYTITTPRQIMNTTLFSWDSTRQIDVFAREDYDNTVNLYFCDWLNPNRVINSGFDQEGNIKNRLYNDASFNSIMNQFLTTSTNLEVELREINTQGQLKYGNYIFYFRYVNASQNSTPFIVEDGPIQIFEGIITDMSKVEGGDWNLASDKKVIFDLNNVDLTYSFIEVAYTRYFGDSNMVVQSENKLIVRQYPITVTPMTIEITGQDIELDLALSDIIANITLEDRCKSHCQVDNIYWGANWKGIAVDDTILANFASLIETYYTDSQFVDVNSFYGIEHQSLYHTNNDVSGLIDAEGQYKDYFKTYDRVGYFRTESYAFGVIFELNNGSLTNVYATKGFDELNGHHTGSSISTEISPGVESGVHRFPRVYTSPIIDSLGAKIMGIQFDCSNAWSVLTVNSDPVTRAWFEANVRSMYFVRTERYVNLLYQGLAMNCCTDHINGAEAHDDMITTENYSVWWNYANDQHDPNCVHAGNNLPMDYSPGQNNPGYNGGNSIGQVPMKIAGWFGFVYGAQNFYHSFWGAVQDVRNIVGLGLINNIEAMGSDFIRSSFINYIPLYKGYMPMTYHLGKPDSTSNAWETSSNYLVRFPMRKRYVAIYSPDSIFSIQTNLNSAIYVERIFKVDFDEKIDYDIEGSFDIFPHILFADMSNIINYDDTDSLSFPIVQDNLTNSDIKKVGTSFTANYPGSPVSLNNDNFVNAGYDHARGGSPLDVIFWMTKTPSGWGQNQVWTTRSAIATDYILFNWNTAYSQLDDFNNSIVSIYKSRPLSSDTISLFNSNPSSTQYYKISDAIQLYANKTFLPQPNMISCYRGDCFLQKTYFKQLVWGGTDIIVDGNPTDRKSVV